MRYVLAVALACGLLVAATSAVEAASSPVQVRVYDATVMPVANQTVALRAAAGVLTAAGIDVTWIECGDGSVTSPEVCAVPLGRTELSVRFVRLAATPVAGQIQLGYALVDTAIAEGKLATVYVDRVDWLAVDAGADPSVVLGFAVAHEIGHLLLGTNAHAARGLMRALWSRRELAHAQASDWQFSSQEGAQMRASLAERNGLRSSEHDATGCAAPRDRDTGAASGCGDARVASLRGVAPGGDR